MVAKLHILHTRNSVICFEKGQEKAVCTLLAYTTTDELFIGMYQCYEFASTLTWSSLALCTY